MLKAQKEAMTNQLSVPPWLVMVAAMWTWSAQAEPVSPDKFQALTQSRDAALGAVVYSDASIAVHSKSVNIKQKTCSMESVIVDETTEGDKARFMAEQAQWEAAAQRRNEAFLREVKALNAKLQDEVNAMLKLPPNERPAKSREIQALQREGGAEIERRYPMPPQPKPLRMNKREFKFLELVVLVKDLPPQNPIIQTVPPFTDGLSLEKHFGTRWEAAPGALDIYVHKVLPAVVRFCPEVSSVKLSLGFQEVADVSVQPPGHFEVAKIVMAKQPNGSWAPQHIDTKGKFDLSVFGVSRHRVTSATSHGKLAWLDLEEWNDIQFDDLKLQHAALAIEIRDLQCGVDGCPSKCGPDDDSCPGGMQAAMSRDNLRSCSKENQWASKNCKIIESFFGRLDQSLAIDVPAEFESLYDTLKAGKRFSPNRVNVAFTSGLGIFLVDKCRILKSDEAAVIRQFSQAGWMANLWPGQRSVTQQAGAMASAVAAIKEGRALGERIACRSPETYMLAKKIVRSIQVSPQNGGSQ